MTVEITGRIDRETDAAIQLWDYVREEHIWFPLSQVEEIHRNKNGDGSLVVSDWIARQKGY